MPKEMKLQCFLLQLFFFWAVCESRTSSSHLPRRQHVFDLSDFGATGDGITDNTRVFRNALYAVSGVADKGGGQLYVPPGRYVTGSFNLTSNMTLYLARDAVILGIADISFWPIVAPLPSYGRGREFPGPRYSSLLFGNEISDVIITGENGTIDGQGAFWWKMLSKGQLSVSRGSLVEVLSVKRLLISNVTFLNPPFWAIHPVYSSDVVISDVTIFSPSWSPQTHGIVPDSCKNVRIHRADISTGGDAISIKSGWDEYGTAVGIPSENISISGVSLESLTGATFSVGSEMSGGVRNVTLKKANLYTSNVAISLQTGRGRGGEIRDVNFEEVEITNVEVGIQLVSNSSDHPDEGFDPSDFPQVTGIRFTNISGFNIGKAGVLEGFREAPFVQLTLENVSLGLRKGGSGFSCTFVSGWAKNVEPDICQEIEKFNSSILVAVNTRTFKSTSGPFVEK